jgi:glyoxylase-like metal-dependent hydrolase (beta-lactamase superfamily II)
MDWYRVESPAARDYWREILKKQFHFRPRRPARFLRDGELIDLGVVTVEVLRTPGHSPGQLALFFREPKILFLGDYDLAPIGPWYGEVYATIEDTFQSIRRLKDIPAELWLTCHGKGVFDRIPDDRWQQYEAAIHDRKSGIWLFWTGREHSLRSRRPGFFTGDRWSRLNSMNSRTPPCGEASSVASGKGAHCGTGRYVFEEVRTLHTDLRRKPSSKSV